MKPLRPVLQSARLLAGPLCLAYDTVSFHRARVTVLTEKGQIPMDAHWAFGTHREGSSEVLGCWVAHPLAQLDVEAVGRELRERGLETVGWLALSEGANPTPIATGKDPAEQLVAVGDRLLPGHANRGMGASALMASRLSASLTRHGAFASEEAAKDFVARVLQRLEQAYCWESSSSGCNGAGVRPASLASRIRGMTT